MAGQLTFSVTLQKNGNPENAVSAQLTDSGGTYAIKRLDTDAVVVAAPVTMDNPATGLYTYSLTDPIPGVIYRASRKLVLDNGDTKYSTQDMIAGPVSTLIDYNKFIRKWTSGVIAKLTNKSHTGSDTIPDQDLINDAFVWAEGYLNFLLAGGAYTTPLVFSGAVSAVVEEWLFVLAFARLYYDRWDDSGDIDEIDGQQVNQTARKVKSRISEVFNDIALCKFDCDMLSGATLNTSYDRTPSLLSERDIQDAGWDLLRVNTRMNLWN